MLFLLKEDLRRDPSAGMQLPGSGSASRDLGFPGAPVEGPRVYHDRDRDIVEVMGIAPGSCPGRDLLRCSGLGFDPFLFFLGFFLSAISSPSFLFSLSSDVRSLHTLQAAPISHQLVLTVLARDILDVPEPAEQFPSDRLQLGLCSAPT